MQRNQRSNCQHLLNHQKSKRVPEKHVLLLYWLCQNLWLCWSQETVENSERDGYQTTWPASWEIYIQVKKQHVGVDMKQQTGSKSGKEYVKAVYSHPAYLTYMQSIISLPLRRRSASFPACWYHTTVTSGLQESFPSPPPPPAWVPEVPPLVGTLSPGKPMNSPPLEFIREAATENRQKNNYMSP